VLGASVVHAQQRDADARLAYAQGREAYQTGKYELALQKFRYCYTLSGEPALLYNISAALQSLDRPGDAADALQQYLTARPADPQRAEIETRIANLRQAQALVDKEAQRKQQLEAPKAASRGTVSPSGRNGDQPPAIVFTTPPPGWMSDAEADQLVTRERARERANERARRRHKDLVLGLSIGLGLVAAGGIVAGVVCGTGHCIAPESREWDFSKNAVTP
jgi:tetratricopeptide (TPR) repeat protein